METNNKAKREILPDKGIWTVEDLALYLKVTPHQLLQGLTDNGIKTIPILTRARGRLIRLEDLKPKGIEI